MYFLLNDISLRIPARLLIILSSTSASFFQPVQSKVFNKLKRACAREKSPRLQPGLPLSRKKLWIEVFDHTHNIININTLNYCVNEFHTSGSPSGIHIVNSIIFGFQGFLSDRLHLFFVMILITRVTYRHFFPLYICLQNFHCKASCIGDIIVDVVRFWHHLPYCKKQIIFRKSENWSKKIFFLSKQI